MHEARHYFRYNDRPDAKGAVILERDDDEHIIITENRGGEWCDPFLMPDEELYDLDTTHVGQLDEEKFRRVKEHATHAIV